MEVPVVVGLDVALVVRLVVGELVWVVLADVVALVVELVVGDVV